MRRALALLLLLAACTGDGKKGITEPPPPPPEQPEPGTLTLTLATPHADDAALVLTVAGPEAITQIQAAGALRVHSRGEGTQHRVAVFGAVASGAVLRFAVPDVRRAAGYTATLVEVADTANQVRASTAGYTLSVAR